MAQHKVCVNKQQDDKLDKQSVLQLGSVLLFDLRTVCSAFTATVARAPADEQALFRSDKLCFAEKMTSAVDRLKTMIDNLGLEWIKNVMGSSETTAKLEELCQEVLKSPSPFLNECINTCTLISTAKEFPEEFDGGFNGLVGVLPLYAKTCSFNGDLMKTISQKSFDRCLHFQKSVDSRLMEVCASFQQNVEQLSALEEKYGLLGLCVGIMAAHGVATQQLTVKGLRYGPVWQVHKQDHDKAVQF